MAFFSNPSRHRLGKSLLPVLAFSIFFACGCKAADGAGCLPACNNPAVSANAYKAGLPFSAHMGPGHKTEVKVAPAVVEEEKSLPLRTTRIKKEVASKVQAQYASPENKDKDYNRTVKASKLKEESSSSDLVPQASSVQIITNERYSVAIVPATKIDVAYFPKGMTAKEYAKTHPEAAVAINGGYFDQLPDGTYLPVGLLVASGSMRFKSSLRVAEGEDEQRIPYAIKARKESTWYTSFFVNTDGKAGILPILQLDAATNPEYDDLKTGWEAGPSILKDGQLNAAEISKRGTGGRVDFRSVIGICDNGDVILYCSKVPMTLYDAANEIKSLGASEAMALEGGPEVSFCAPSNPQAGIEGMTTAMIIYARK